MYSYLKNYDSAIVLCTCTYEYEFIYTMLQKLIKYKTFSSHYGGFISAPISAMILDAISVLLESSPRDCGVISHL
jgi:hypothetical protein